jgi:AcrR family transcriptional regulator
MSLDWRSVKSYISGTGGDTMQDSKSSDDRRNEFVDAAEKLFKENGIVDTTISSIVKEMDVAKGLFYYYFKSKDDVIDAISEKYNQSFRESMNKSMDVDDFNRRLDQFIENSIVSFKNMWGNLNSEGKNIDLSILSTRSLDEAKAAASKSLQALLEEGNRLNKLDIRQPKYYADIIIGGITDLVKQGETDVDEIKRIIEDLLDKSRKD